MTLAHAVTSDGIVTQVLWLLLRSDVLERCGNSLPAVVRPVAVVVTSIVHQWELITTHRVKCSRIGQVTVSIADHGILLYTSKDWNWTPVR